MVFGVDVDGMNDGISAGGGDGDGEFRFFGGGGAILDVTGTTKGVFCGGSSESESDDESEDEDEESEDSGIGLAGTIAFIFF